MMLSISREPRPLPLKSSATTSENSQLDWSRLVTYCETPTMRSVSTISPSAAAILSLVTATSAISRS